MPNASVASEQLPIRLRQVRDDVAAGEREHAARLLCRVPLHAVSRSDLAELRGVVEERKVWGVRQLAVVSRRAEIQLSSSFGSDVETDGRSRGRGCTAQRGGARSA